MHILSFIVQKQSRSVPMSWFLFRNAVAYGRMHRINKNTVESFYMMICKTCCFFVFFVMEQQWNRHEYTSSPL